MEKYKCMDCEIEKKLPKGTTEDEIKDFGFLCNQCMMVIQDGISKRLKDPCDVENDFV